MYKSIQKILCQKRSTGTFLRVRVFERSTRGKAMHGFTPNYIRVELAAKDAREEYDNQLMRVRLGAFNRDGSALKAIGL